MDYNDSDKVIYENELKGFLPPRLFDAHVHVFDKGSFSEDYTLPSNHCYHKVGGDFSLELYCEYMGRMLPDQTVYCNSFGSPDLETNREAAAVYTGAVSDNNKFFGMALVSPKDTIENVRRRIEANHLIGYKPYLNFVDWKQAKDITIFDMLTEEQMEYADAEGLVITLHIPRPGRLADPVNQKQMVELCQKYPNTQIVFAHIGRAYYMKNIVGWLADIATCPNAWLDTAMVNNEAILEYAFNNFPRERILFGSDAPIALLRGKSVEINNSYAYLMGEDYMIGSALYDPNSNINFTTFFYEQLRGVKLASERAQLSGGEIENILFSNAFNLFSATANKKGY